MPTVTTATAVSPDLGSIALRAGNLSKCYRIYERPRDRVKQALMPRLRGFFARRGVPPSRKQYYREHWALRNVSLEIMAGETVGIVGRNGSGKSTLLELITGILTPTDGSVRAHGRIAALLELGAGFNPEFSGRENVFLNAALMGLDRPETEERFDEIVAFSELADYIDRPLRTYSSGMFVRLAFSVAINVKPSILVIDEALAVGDEAFQRKCYSRIQQFQAQGGTILFVSHSSAAVIELCSSAILLDKGEMLFSGLPRDVIAQYQKLLYAPPEQVTALRDDLRARQEQARPEQSGAPVDKPGEALQQPVTGEAAFYDPGMVPRSTLRYDHRGAHIDDACIVSATGDRVNLLVQRHDYVFTYRVRFEKAARRTRFGMLIKTTSGYELGGATSAEIGQGQDIPVPGSTVEVRFRFKCLLTPGTYFLNAGVVGQVDGTELFLDRWIDVVMFKVMPGGYPLATGSVDLLIEPSLSLRTATETLPE